jgi:hypothetical protein
MTQEKLVSDRKELDTSINNRFYSNILNRPFIAGFWLIAAVVLTLLFTFLIGNWVHRQETQQVMLLPILIIMFGVTTYKWANSLIRRSDLRPSKAIGMLAGIFFFLSIFGTFAGGYELIFVSVMKVLNITQTTRGTRPEFYVVFVIWTGIVTGFTGLGVGLGLKKLRLAFKLLVGGLITGAVVFFLVAAIMELVGFRVGTPRPDRIPSMPIVTVLGICLAALVDSELFGMILIRDNKQWMSI